MPRKTKKFIDKNKAVTFQLVHRSQRDPLAADDEAPQRVLIPISDPVTDCDFSSETTRGRESRLSMLRTYGIAFDDDYNYMQHLREPDQQTAVLVPKDGRILDDGNFFEEEEETTGVPISGGRSSAIRMPSVVFASEREEEVGMLHRAIPPVGPQVEWDPDVVAALDEDYNFDDPDNIIEDDFVLKATGDDNDCDDDVDEKYVDSDEDFSGSDRAGSWMGEEEGMFAEEETRSRFTQYSMTSSVIPRNEHLTLLDDQFEKFYETYDDEKIGDLGQVEIDGAVPVHDIAQKDALKMLLGIIDEEPPEEKRPVILPERHGASDAAASSASEEEEGGKDDEDELTELFKDVSKEKWDCESILSTYSNIYNHPKVIEDLPKANSERIRLSKKTGIPLDTLPTRGLTTKQLRTLDLQNEEEDEGGRVRAASESSEVNSNVRRKDESKEAKAARKKAVKEMRRERRSEKKATKMAFRQEKTRQHKEYLNIQQNLSGIRIT